MKKLCLIFVSFLALACSGPQNYVRKAVGVMDKQGFFAQGPAWEEAKDIALEADPQTMDEAYTVVKEALKVAGGKHSFIYCAEKITDDRTSEWKMPTVNVDDSGIATLVIPAFSGNREEGTRYARTVIDAVPDDVKGVIIDLRGNRGGNMYPMIASVHRFIADGDNMLRFRSRKRTNWVQLPYVCSGAGVEMKTRIECPVALLTDSLTGSSGEATLLCFRGQQDVRTFGAPTAGYASCNTTFPMPDGSSLVLTTGCDVARTDETFCDDPIAPDVITDDPEREAKNWILLHGLFCN